ncbi:MAG: HEAT repeat domain-containing protein [Planctomycetota bacterium]
MTRRTAIYFLIATSGLFAGSLSAGPLVCVSQAALVVDKHAPKTDLEKRAAAIHTELQTLDPAELGRADQRATKLLEKLEGFGAEARVAIPTLKAFASQEELAGYRFDSLERSVRLLASMGDEGLPALRDVLKESSRETIQAILYELERSPQFDLSPLFPTLMGIANRDQHRPSEETIQAEREAFEKANPDVDLQSGFFVKSGSKSLDEFREVEINSRLAIEVMLDSRQNRELVLQFILGRIRRVESPSFDGIERFIGEPSAIAALKDIAIGSEAAEMRLVAAEYLVDCDPSGQVSIPVLLQLFGDTEEGFGHLVYEQAVNSFKAHPARKGFDLEKVRIAVENIPEKERARIKLELLETDAQKAARLEMNLEGLKGENERESLNIADELLGVDPDNETAIDFLLALVKDNSKPTYIQTISGFGQPGPLSLRPLAARSLGKIGLEHRDRVLRVLYAQSRKYTGEPGKAKRSDLATSAAWSVAQLNREYKKSLNFALETSVAPFSNTYVARPFYGQSGKYVAQVLGDRIDVYADRLVKQAFQGTSNQSKRAEVMFAREILLNAEPGESKSRDVYLRMLVEEAFERIRAGGEGRHVAIDFFLDTQARLLPAFDLILGVCKSQDYESRKIAIYLCGNFQKYPEATIPVLIDACADDRALCRCRAAKALAKFGPAAIPAIPKLRSMTSDDYRSVVDAANLAIRKIEN